MRQSAEDRFWSKVKRTDGCWEWQGHRNAKGYGVFGLTSLADGVRVKVLAHRFSWECGSGPIPDGMCVLHHCDNARCVCPSHLFIGDRLDNNRDMVAKGRSNGWGYKERLEKTHCPKGHPYTGPNLGLTQTGWRCCRQCRNEYTRKWRQRSSNTGFPGRRTHCKRGHELNGENLYIPPNSPNDRMCRMCRRTVQRERRAKRRLLGA